MDIPLPSWQETLDAGKFILAQFDKHKKPVLLKAFFRDLERKLKTRLSQGDKDRFFEMLNDEDRIIKDKKGKQFVTRRPIGEYL